MAYHKELHLGCCSSPISASAKRLMHLSEYTFQKQVVNQPSNQASCINLVSPLGSVPVITYFYPDKRANLKHFSFTHKINATSLFLHKSNESYIRFFM